MGGSLALGMTAAGSPLALAMTVAGSPLALGMTAAGSPLALAVTGGIVRGQRLRYDEGMRVFYVYIMASQSGTLYVGVTNNIRRRVLEHKNHQVLGFTDKYDVDRLLYVETFTHAASAIRREKQVKAWRREKKTALIDSMNPQWRDLSLEW